MTKNALLSKTTFLKSLQCEKLLFLYKNYYYLRDPLSAEKQALFTRGNHVGKFARKLFPGGKDASPKSPLKQAEWVNNTAKLIASGTKVIYEAAFIYKDVFVAIDMLVKKENYWEAYEVKSSRKISSIYRTDAALQYYVISNQDLNLKNIYLVYVNTAYKKRELIDPSKLFLIENVTSHSVKNRLKIEGEVEGAKMVLKNKNIPSKNIGEHCFEPYKCDFKGHCWKHEKNLDFFELPGISKKEQFELHAKEIPLSESISTLFLSSKLGKIHLKSKLNNAPQVEHSKIKSFLKPFKYPLFFIDFEAFMPAIPIYNNTTPFEASAFQFSIHYQSKKGAKPIHFEFLAEAGLDQREKFIVSFLNFTQKKGSLVAFDISGEKKLLNSLSTHFPEHALELKNRTKRLQDLSTPFSNYHYYHHLFNGSTSLKSIAKVLLNDVSYDGLKIKNGNMASAAFDSLYHEMDIIKITEIRENLLEYCKQDSLVLLKIFEHLNDYK